ncbi:NYN domain-containing protein [Helicobacter pylori]|uniref:NYN domain-containing protein n=1 Tax=Helicobacter pylori TaxID=210 RepID=UPI003F9364BF
MEKTETTIFVDWENLLTDLRAIQKNPKTDKRFKEPDFSFNNPEQLLALIRSFLEPEEELKRIYFYASEPFTEVEPRIKGNKNKEPRLKLRQKQIDALLAHDITKLYCTKQGGCILLFSKDTDFVPMLEAAWEKGFEVFIANIQEGPNLVPPDLRKSCNVRERSVAEILAKLPKVATTSNTPKKENSNEPFNNTFKDLHKKN